MVEGQSSGMALALPARMQPGILIVDDEESILFAMREYFMAHGCQVDCAADRAQAEELLTHGRYAVVIADLRLTGSQSCEGLEIVSFVHERWPATRTVVLTAYGSPELEREARKRGVDAFLHKPKPLAEVAHVVFELLGVASRPAGLRDAAGAGRRLLHHAGGADLDLEISECSGGEPAYRVTGQLLVPGSPPTGDLLAALWCEGVLVAQAMGNPVGIFVFKRVPPGVFRLEIWASAGERVIRVEPFMVGEQERCMSEEER